MKRILIVEDDPTLRMGLEDSFISEGYEVVVAQDGVQAEEFIYSRHFDLIMLDLMMPLKGGMEVLRRMREEELMTPVILLTARSDENDKVLGLELGADDYVTKPFSLRELFARAKVLLRREEQVLKLLAKSAPLKQFQIGTAQIDLDLFEVKRAGQKFPMTPKEAAMVGLLFSEAGKVVSRARFLAEVWGGGEWVSNRTVDTHMLNIRKKIEDDPKAPQHIVTVHGVGYRLNLGADAPSSQT